MFMNFAEVEVTMDPTNAFLNLAEGQLETGMTPFSNRPWGMVIHKLEFFSPNIDRMEGGNGLVLCLSTRQELAVLPRLLDLGTIGEAYWAATGAAWSTVNPHHSSADYLPPVVVCTPKLSVYGQTTVLQDAHIDGSVCGVRIGFTTVEMTPTKWHEVNQTWSLVE